MTIYILVRYREGREPKYRLGGGSSTPEGPRVYESKNMAERYAKRYGAEIIEVEI